MRRILAAALVAAFAAGASLVAIGLDLASAQPRAGRPEQIARGEYLARIGDCLACHTVRGGEAYAGGLGIPTPFGKLFSPNITPDPETGIGKWTAEDFWRAMHLGRSRDGSFLYPAFPFTNYTKVTREDCDAIYAFFMALNPVRQRNRPQELRFPYNQRQLLAVWRTLYFKSGVFTPDPKQTREWNRGAYLVDGLGHCNACHGSRNVLGAVSDYDVGGGLIPVQNWYAPSLTSSRETGLGERDVKEIVDLLRTGVSKQSAVYGPMSAVVFHSLSSLTVGDITAMAVYLQSQHGKGAAPELRQVKPTFEQTMDMLTQGSAIYKKHCADCHQRRGEGVPRIYPPLAKNKTILMPYPINAIRMVLVGGFPPSTEGNPRPYGMPPFAQNLSDQEVAAVVTYIRFSWGNSAPPVSPAEVASARGVPAD
ncbi:MAG: c-type cytochrome [Burkholderiales bacterium]